MYSGNEEWLSWAKHSTEDYEFCPSWMGEFSFVVCRGKCPRANRPFACRSFPLVPHLSVADEVSMVFDPNGVLICPLVQLGDMSVLDPRFISACCEAWKILMEANPPILDDVTCESARRSGPEDAAHKLRRLMDRGDDGV